MTFEQKSPDKVKFLKNPEDCKLKPFSSKQVETKCPVCGMEKMMRLSSLTTQNFYCNRCRSLGAVKPEVIVLLVNKEDQNLPNQSRKRIAIMCPTCLTQKTTLVYNLTNKNFKCQECAKIKNKHPELMEHLVDKKDGELPCGSNRKILVQCKLCGETSEKAISNFTNRGFRCSVCSDYRSTGEKFVEGFLKELNVPYIREFSDGWTQKRRFDFLITDKRILVEVHGIQHYEESRRGRSLVVEQLNDKWKRERAIENGFKLLVIDARESSKKHLISSVTEAFKDIYKLGKVDFDALWLKSQNSIFLEIIEDYAENILTIKEIAEKYSVNKSTVVDYAKRAGLSRR